MTNIKATKLENGLTIVTENVPFIRSFSLGFWFLVGSRDETSDNNGISHFIEHMFFKGTEKRSAKQIAEEIESLGGYLNAFTTKEHTCFYGRGLTDNFENTFEVLADMLQNSLFAQNEIEKERNVVIDELYDIEDSPEELIFDKLESSLYKGNSLGFPIIGTETNIKSFKTEDLKNFIAEKYSSDNMFVVVSGNVKHEDVVELSKRYLIDSFNGKTNRSRVSEFNIGDEFHQKEIQQSHFIYAAPTYGFESDKRAAVNILSHILGEGSSSRLFQRLREENGITYQINTFVNSFWEVSSFGVYFSTNHSFAHKAMELVNDELDRIKSEEVSEKELNKAKEYIKGNLLMSLESTTNRMIRLAHSFMYFGKFKSVDESLEEINRVTSKDINELANEILQPRNMSRIILSSQNHFIHSAA
ncbi:MAG: insulinase family protein [Ignavibacteria bacterium]|nr:MAG: insulinase family protein [Ignavibacteria bacterium]